MRYIINENFKECEEIIRNKNIGEKEKIELLKPILESDPKLVRAAGKDNQTLLHVAAFSNSKEAVQLLLGHGANIESKNYYDYTPLFEALELGNLEMVRFLLDYGADVEARSRSGRTPLIRAVRADVLSSTKKEIIKLLLRNGAKADTKDVFNHTPLFCAIDYLSSRDTKLFTQYIIQYMLIQNSDENNCLMKQDSDAGKTSIIKKKAHFLNYWNECKIEADKMRKQKIGNSKVSFYNFLAADKNELVGYLEDDDVVQELSNGSYERFSIYANEIKSQYQKGMERKDLVDAVHIVMKHSNMEVLNNDTHMEVIKHLANRDLQNLKEARVLDSRFSDVSVNNMANFNLSKR